MQLTKEQIEFLDKVCRYSKWTLNEKGEVDVDGNVNISSMNLTEIPVKFGIVEGYFRCSHNKLTTLKNCPTSVGGSFYCEGNNLKDYFKNLKEEDFPHWDKLRWGWILKEYPFLINIMMKYYDMDYLIHGLNEFPLTKLYLK